MWTLRQAEKVLSLNHFSWFHSSQTEGKGLRQLTFPELVYQQNGLSLSHLSTDPKHRVCGHPAALFGAASGKEEGPLGYLELSFSKLVDAMECHQVTEHYSSMFPTSEAFSLLQLTISSMSHVLFGPCNSSSWSFELSISIKKSKYSPIYCLRKIWFSVRQWLKL